MLFAVSLLVFGFWVFWFLVFGLGVGGVICCVVAGFCFLVSGFCCLVLLLVMVMFLAVSVRFGVFVFVFWCLLLAVVVLLVVSLQSLMCCCCLFGFWFLVFGFCCWPW